MATTDSHPILNPFDLPTQQRRLRHFKSLAVRNLVCKGYMGKDVVKLQTYFTLHKDVQSKAFYTSEKITGSLNPSWQSFDLSRIDGDIDMAAKFVTVRVWGGHDKKFRLLMEWQVHFSGLSFLTDKLQRDTMKFATNSVVFGLFEKYFSLPSSQTPSSQTIQQQPEDSFPSVKVDQATLHTSYRVTSLSRIHTILRAIRQTQVTVRRVHRSIEDKLLASQEKSSKLSEREMLLLKVDQLRSELQWQTSQLQNEKEKRNKQKNLLKQRGLELQENSLSMATQHEGLLNRHDQHIEKRESLVRTNAQLNMRRKQLIEELSTYIYPITELPKGKGYSICGIHLPNAEQFQGHDEYSIAVALGYASHMIIMMSEYLDTPLWYPMMHRGSKSVIRDHITAKLPEKDREFVLYGKGKEKIPFHYGVYLLNKNISQLRYQFGLGTQDLRLTLLNLKSLLELRLGVKFEDTKPQVVSPINSGGRQISIDTSNSNAKEIGESDIHGNDGTEGHTHSNQDQMIEQLIEESRAMTVDQSNNGGWVENLNTKQTWSPSVEKKMNDDKVERNSSNSTNGFVSDVKWTNETSQSLDDETDNVSDNSSAINSKLSATNVTAQIDSDEQVNDIVNSASTVCDPETSQSADVQSESETQHSIGYQDKPTKDHTFVTGTFKTSAFKNVTSIDSSEEATESNVSSPVDLSNVISIPSNSSSLYDQSQVSNQTVTSDSNTS